MAWYGSALVRRVLLLMTAGVVALLAVVATSLWLSARTAGQSRSLSSVTRQERIMPTR